MNKTNSVTSVSAQGSVETDYDSVTFRVYVTTEAKTSDEVKAKLKEKVDSLNSIVDELKKSGLVVTDGSLVGSPSFSPVIDYKKNKRVIVAHSARYDFSFKTNDVTMATQVVNALNSVEEVTVYPPAFYLKDSEKVNKDAFKNALDKIKSRFADECLMLNLSVDDFEIESWEATYSDSYRNNSPRYAMAGLRAKSMSVSSEPDNTVDVYVGKATVQVNLEVSFKRKNNA